MNFLVTVHFTGPNEAESTHRRRVEASDALEAANKVLDWGEGTGGLGDVTGATALTIMVREWPAGEK